MIIPMVLCNISLRKSYNAWLILAKAHVRLYYTTRTLLEKLLINLHIIEKAAMEEKENSLKLEKPL